MRAWDTAHAILAFEADGSQVYDLKIPGCRPDISPDGKRIAWGASDWTLCVGELDFSGGVPKSAQRPRCGHQRKADGGVPCRLVALREVHCLQPRTGAEDTRHDSGSRGRQGQGVEHRESPTSARPIAGCRSRRMGTATRNPTGSRFRRNRHETVVSPIRTSGTAGLGNSLPEGRSHGAGDRCCSVVHDRRDRQRYRNGVDSGRSLRHGMRRRRSRAGTGSRSGSRRVSHGPLRGHSDGLCPIGPDQRITFQRSRASHGDDQLGQGCAVLQLAIRSGRSPAVLQRCGRVRLRGQRVPAANRGGMGIRLPGRHRHAVQLWQRTRTIWSNTHGTPATRTRKRTRWDARSPTPGDSSTCTATWPNGATTTTIPTTTEQSPTKNPRGPAEGDKNVLRGGHWGASDVVMFVGLSSWRGAGVFRRLLRSRCHRVSLREESFRRRPQAEPKRDSLHWTTRLRKALRSAIRQASHRRVDLPQLQTNPRGGTAWPGPRPASSTATFFSATRLARVTRNGRSDWRRLSSGCVAQDCWRNSPASSLGPPTSAG